MQKNTLAANQDCASDETHSGHPLNPQTSSERPQALHGIRQGTGAYEPRSRWRSQEMSVACTHIHRETLSIGFLGNEKESCVLNSILNKPDGTGFAGKLAQRSGPPSPTGFPCQQPQKRDEAYTA